MARQGADGAVFGSWRAYGLTDPQGITTDSHDVWIVDAGTKQVYLYPGMAQVSSLFTLAMPSSSFSLRLDGTTQDTLTSPSGIALGLINGVKRFWVTDDVLDRVYVYELDGTPVTNWPLDVGNSDPAGITGSLLSGTDSEGDDLGSTLWVVDRGNDRVYKYPAGKNHDANTQNIPSKTFSLLANENTAPEGIADPAGQNTDPVVQADTHYLVTSGTAVKVYALNNDYDVDGDRLTITSVGTPSYGTAAISSNGDYITYTPGGSFADDSFSYTISDGYGGTATGTIYFFLDDDAYGGYGGYGGSAHNHHGHHGHARHDPDPRRLSHLFTPRGLP